MADEKKTILAKEVYATLCKALDEREWHYEKEEDDLTVRFAVNGEDLTMRFIILIDAERQLIRLLSPMPYKMDESKRMDGAIATCAVSYGLVDGSFDYDISDGTISFRMTASFHSSQISTELFQYMISCACYIVDEYNDKFFALSKGLIDINSFISE